MSDQEPLFTYFCDFLIRHQQWQFPILVDHCDRCGVWGTSPVALAEPVPIQLQLCAPCTAWVREEMAKYLSGVLGLAGVYAFAYGIALRESRAP